LATISFFPEFQKVPRGSFVYLQNQGTNQFTASTFAESATGRWLSLDAGDFDRDGDEDLVLGSYIRGPTPMPKALMDEWNRGQRPLVLLQNQAVPGPERPPSAAPKP
jgi:hypothetical protein